MIRPAYRRISAEQAADLITWARSLPVARTGMLAIFDVRDRASFERAHVEGAEHFIEASMGDILARVRRDTVVMIYCYRGNASQTVARTFSDFRYTEVYSVDGGFEALASALRERTPSSNVFAS